MTKPKTVKFGAWNRQSKVWVRWLGTAPSKKAMAYRLEKFEAPDGIVVKSIPSGKGYGVYEQDRYAGDVLVSYGLTKKKAESNLKRILAVERRTYGKSIRKYVIRPLQGR